jgi:hypothetical protein
LEPGVSTYRRNSLTLGGRAPDHNAAATSGAADFDGLGTGRERDLLELLDFGARKSRSQLDTGLELAPE